jgi:hypothetical protein
MKDSSNGSNGSGQRVRRHFSPQQKAAIVKEAKGREQYGYRRIR